MRVRSLPWPSPAPCLRGHAGCGPDHQGAGADDQAGHQGRDGRQGSGAPLGAGVPARRAAARHRAARAACASSARTASCRSRCRACRTVYASGQGGLLDVALSPDFASSGLIYFSYAEPRERRHATAPRSRAPGSSREGDGGRLDDVQVIFRQEPSYASSSHFGSRIVFMPDGSLFITLGDRYSARDEAQNPANHLGKLVRIMPDGSPLRRQSQARRLAPGDLVDRPPQRAGRGAQSRHRQAVDHRARRARRRRDQHPARPARTTAGRSSPTAATTPAPRSARAPQKAGMEQPIYYWDPSIAPSGAAFYTGDLFPEWKGNLFVGALAGQALHRLVLDGEKVVGEEALLKDLRRAHPRRAPGPRRRHLAADRRSRRAACCGWCRRPDAAVTPLPAARAAATACPGDSERAITGCTRSSDVITQSPFLSSSAKAGLGLSIISLRLRRPSALASK